MSKVRLAGRRIERSLTSSFLLTRSRLADGRGTLGIFFAGPSELVEALVRRACEVIIGASILHVDGVRHRWSSIYNTTSGGLGTAKNECGAIVGLGVPGACPREYGVLSETAREQAGEQSTEGGGGWSPKQIVNSAQSTDRHNVATEDTTLDCRQGGYKPKLRYL